jgi:hypothetical protein
MTGQGKGRRSAGRGGRAADQGKRTVHCRPGEGEGAATDQGKGS